MENSIAKTSILNWMIKKSFNSKICIFYLKVVLTLSILWILIYHSQLKIGLMYKITDNPFLCLIVVCLLYSTMLINTWRWYRLNSVQNIQLSIFKTIMPSYLGMAYNNILPGSIGGDFFRLFYVMKKFPEQKSGVVLSIFLDRVCGLMGIFIVACTMGLFCFDIFNHNNALFYLLIMCIGFCAFSVIGFFIVTRLFHSEGRLGKWILKCSNTRWSKLFSSFFAAIYLYRNSKRIILEGIAVSIISQLVLLTAIMLINNMMGLPKLSASIYMLALAIGQVANLVPLTPGGVGIGEAAFANIIFMMHPGVNAAYATVFFAYRLISTLTYLPGVFIGIFGFGLFNSKYSRPNIQTSIRG